ncbi:PAS domain S-box protein [uncultured Cyclobacterium sp.]|uniref:PAS domain S-box protein n=1 Tax=uncultured Cyclobacterium sp. TaxID=453820 RepID=UPI0030EEC833
MSSVKDAIGIKAVNQIPESLVYWDTNEICQFANTSFLNWLGKPYEKVIGKLSLRDALGQSYQKQIPHLKEVLAGNPQKFSLDINNESEGVNNFSVSYTPDIENDKLVGFTAYYSQKIDIKEITEVKPISINLHENILEFAPDAIVIINSSGIIQYVNQQFEHIFGYAKHEAINKEIEFLLPEKLKEKHKSHIKSFFLSSNFRPMGKGLELYGQRKNGENFNVEISLIPAQSNGDSLVMASIRDVSEQKNIETELEESNKRNGIFIQQSPYAIAMLDKELRYMAVSEKWRKDYAMEGKEIVGKSYYELFPNIKENRKKDFQACLAGKKFIKKEELVFGQKGNNKWIKSDIRPWYITEGEIGGLLMHTEDLTLIKNKEKEKVQVEAILEKTSAIARIGTWEFNLEEEKLIWSKVVREIHEVSEDFIPDVNTAINFYKEGRSRELISKAVANAIEIGNSFDLEIELVTAKGNEVWVRSIGQAEFMEGRCKRIFGIFQDITSVKKAEIKLSRVNEELNAMLNSELVSVIGTDNQGTINHFNRGAEKMLQYSKSEMIGKKTPQVYHTMEEMVKAGKEISKKVGREISGLSIFAEIAKQQGHGPQEWTYVRKDGKHISVLLALTSLKNQQGEVFGYLGIATDITELVENQNKLKKANENLEVLTEKLTSQNLQLANFAHITSHNLRAPANNLNSLLQFYHTSEGQEIKSTIIENFETVSKHLISTLDNLVDLLKIQHEGSKKIEILTFDEILGKTKEMLVGHIMESKAQIIADFSQAPKITFNRIFLEIIFLNLVGNAIKYRSPDREPIIQLKSHKDSGRIVLSVKDNGLGIDLKKHGRNLFGLHKTFHENKEAKGMGLFLTKKHVEAMGGVISAKSEVGKGTTFTIKF